jgi:hypothetical protein
MTTKTITQNQNPTENKPFFEVNVTREGSQFMAKRGDVEVSGFVSSRLRNVVEEIVTRALDMVREVPFNVHHVANVISDFLAANAHVSDYMSTQLSVKAGDVYMTLGAYVSYDIERNEWRGGVETTIECRWKRWEVKLAVKKRVVFKGINVDAHKLYKELIDAARHAYAIVIVKEE